jgi:hypothetical protein
MGNYFHKFRHPGEEASAAASGVSSPYISYIESTGEVNFEYKNSSVALGDYLHSDGTVNTTAASDVIGVCFIQSNFLPDKKARFISLASMDGTESGADEDKWVYWYVDTDEYDSGSSSIIYNGLYEIQGERIFDRVPVDSNSDGVLDKFDATWGGRLPSDRTDSGASNWTIDNPQDPGTKYYKNTTDRIPSPYTSSGTLNPNYFYKGSIMGSRNCLCDIDGDRNTELLVRHPHPCKPAEFCRAFAPGYKNGEWYLPAIGELGFICPRVQFINTKISAALDAGAYGVVLPFNGLWSSSEFSSNLAWRLYLDRGGVDCGDKGDFNYVRSCLRY